MKKIKQDILKVLKQHNADVRYVHISQRSMCDAIGIDSCNTRIIRLAVESLESEGKIVVDRDRICDNGNRKFLYKLTEKAYTAQQVDATTNSITSVEKNMYFEGNNVTIIEKDGEPLFELYSTGMALGYTKKNSVGTVYAFKSRIDTVAKNAGIVPSVQDVHKYITESQLYDFMLEARTEKCKAFRKWIINDVLPKIRKTGGYVTVNHEEQFINNYFDGFTDELKKEMVMQLMNQVKQKDELLDGVEERATLSEGAKILSIENVTTSDISKGLALAGYGEYEVPSGYSNRCLCPNYKFQETFAEKGYCSTGYTTNKKRMKIDFKRAFFYKIQEMPEIMDCIRAVRDIRLGVA